MNTTAWNLRERVLEFYRDINNGHSQEETRENAVSLLEDLESEGTKRYFESFGENLRNGNGINASPVWYEDFSIASFYKRELRTGLKRKVKNFSKSYAGLNKDLLIFANSLFLMNRDEKTMKRIYARRE
ncbi:MAG: hypothetical protein Q8P15_01005 [Nanoarchaeota archaeon]|nr:hypothetical protein [Nanoarchaeota archaeon]